MAGHKTCSQASRSLCDLLLSQLKREISGVDRHEALKCCSLGITTRFAYAYHRRGGLRVYLYGKETDGPFLTELARNGSIEVAQRRTTKSAWAQLSPYYLELDSERAV